MNAPSRTFVSVQGLEYREIWKVTIWDECPLTYTITPHTDYKVLFLKKDPSQPKKLSRTRRAAGGVELSEKDFRPLCFGSLLFSLGGLRPRKKPN